MMIVYVRNPNLHFELENGRVVRIYRDARSRIDPCAIRVEYLSGTVGEDWGVRGDTFYLDGLMIVDLTDWLKGENPDLGVNAFGHKFLRLFDGGDGSFLPDLLKAVIRAIAAMECGGESAFFRDDQLRQHPAEFDELRGAWKRAYG